MAVRVDSVASSGCVVTKIVGFPPSFRMILPTRSACRWAVLPPEEEGLTMICARVGFNGSYTDWMISGCPWCVESSKFRRHSQTLSAMQPRSGILVFRSRNGDQCENGKKSPADRGFIYEFSHPRPEFSFGRLSFFSQSCILSET
jgi:hypothetical protein